MSSIALPPCRARRGGFARNGFVGILAAVIAAVVVSTLMRSGPSREDQKILAEMKTKVDDLQRRIVLTEDLHEAATLQAEMRTVLEETLPKLSPDGRAGVVIGLKIVNPLLTDGEVYTRRVAEFASSPEASYHTVSSQEDLKNRIATINELDALNTSLTMRFNTVDADAERIVNAESISASTKRQILAGFREGMAKKVESVRTIRDLDTKIFAEWRAALQLMHDRWGQWKADGEMILWDDDAGLAAFEGHLTRIGELADEQSAAQQAMVNAK